MVKNHTFGHLEIKFNKIGGRGARISKEFLRSLLRQIVIRSTKYHDDAKLTGVADYRDHVFTYRERQLHSVVCPAIASLTSHFLIENPLERKPTGKPEYSGSVDYWIFYKHFSFLMELKHTYFGYTRAEHPRTSIAGKLSAALKQLDDIRIEECRNQTFGKGLRKIALEAIVFYRGSRDAKSLTAGIEIANFESLFRKLIENAKIGPKINLRALWVLDRRLVEPFQYGKSYEIYPAVAFIGHLSEIVV